MAVLATLRTWHLDMKTYDNLRDLTPRVVKGLPTNYLARMMLVDWALRALHYVFVLYSRADLNLKLMNYFKMLTIKLKFRAPPLQPKIRDTLFRPDLKRGRFRKIILIAPREFKLAYV